MTDPFVLSLIVEGIHCENCLADLTAALSKVPGVVGVRVDAKTGRADVTPGDIKAEAVLAAVREAGFEARLA
jgi:copper chaperone